MSYSGVFKDLYFEKSLNLYREVRFCEENHLL